MYIYNIEYFGIGALQFLNKSIFITLNLTHYEGIFLSTGQLEPIIATNFPFKTEPNMDLYHIVSNLDHFVQIAEFDYSAALP